MTTEFDQDIESLETAISKFSFPAGDIPLPQPVLGPKKAELATKYYKRAQEHLLQVVKATSSDDKVQSCFFAVSDLTKAVRLTHHYPSLRLLGIEEGKDYKVYFEAMTRLANEQQAVHAYVTLGNLKLFGLGTTAEPQVALEWYLKARGMFAFHGYLTPWEVENKIGPRELHLQVNGLLAQSKEVFPTQHTQQELTTVQPQLNEEEQEKLREALQEDQTALAFCYFAGIGVERNYELGAEKMMQASEADVLALTVAGYCHQYNIGVPRDLNIAEIYYGRGVLLKFAPAQFAQSRLKFNGFASETADLAIAANSYYPPALYLLGQCYWNNREDAPENAEKAQALILAAAEQGFAPAQCQYGTEIKKAEEEVWVDAAAAQDYPPALYRLAVLYAQRDKEGNPFLLRAAAQGYVPAQSALAPPNSFGEVYVGSYHRATLWLTESTWTQDPKQQVMLAKHYHRGLFGIVGYDLGVLTLPLIEPNYELAFQYFEAAAQQGLPEAQELIIDYLVKGLGCTRNIVQAIEYCELAAETCTSAKIKLAELYLNKEAGKTDPVRAIELYIEAIENGKKDKDITDKIWCIYKDYPELQVNIAQAYRRLVPYVGKPAVDKLIRLTDKNDAGISDETKNETFYHCAIGLSVGLTCTNAAVGYLVPILRILSLSETGFEYRRITGQRIVDALRIAVTAIAYKYPENLSTFIDKDSAIPQTERAVFRDRYNPFIMMGSYLRDGTHPNSKRSEQLTHFKTLCAHLTEHKIEQAQRHIETGKEKFPPQKGTLFTKPTPPNYYNLLSFLERLQQDQLLEYWGKFTRRNNQLEEGSTAQTNTLLGQSGSSSVEGEDALDLSAFVDFNQPPDELHTFDLTSDTGTSKEVDMEMSSVGVSVAALHSSDETDGVSTPFRKS